MVGNRWVPITVFCFLVVVLLLKWNTINDPHHWDALGYLTISEDMYLHNFRLVHSEYDTGHPPLAYFPVALLWKIFGTNLVVSHLYTLILGLIGIFFTYKLGEFLFGPVVGLGGMALTAFNQVIFAQMGIVNDAIPVFALSVIAVYFYVRKRMILFLLFGTLMVLAKETASIVLLGLFIHYYAEKIIVNRRLTFRDVLYSLWIAAPLIPLFAFFAFHELTTGWALRTDLLFHKSVFLSQFKTNLFNWFLYDTGGYGKNVNAFNYIISSFILLNIVRFRILKLKSNYGMTLSPKFKSSYGLLILLALLHVALFSYTDDLPRYFAPVMPFYYILGAQSIYMLWGNGLTDKKKNLFYFTLIAMLVFLSISNYNGQRGGVGGSVLESNMEYRDVVLTHRDAVHYIETNFTNAKVVTSWPMSNELENPIFGYVNTPINYSPSWTLTNESYSKGMLLYYSPESADSSLHHVVKEVHKQNITLLARFEKGKKYAEIYRIE